MLEKSQTNGSLKDVTYQMLHGCDDQILECAPNLSPGDCSLLAYLAMGYHLGKCGYFGLTFSLEDSAHIDELKDLSNGYLEVNNDTVKMGVLKLENLEKILRAPYIKPKSVRIC